MSELAGELTVVRTSQTLSVPSYDADSRWWGETGDL